MQTNLKTKNILNPEEAINLYHLSRRKFRSLLDEKNLPFLAYYGSRKIIIREEFEKYLARHPEIRALENYHRKNNMPSDEKFLITTSEAAELFQVDKEQLKQIAKNKKCGIAIKSGRSFLFNREKLEQHLKGGKQHGK